ncbi:MAG: GNAT family N-acetyltransferase [Rhodospirillaceae bacterium]|nr:GNAT family N-acetyltransferase [Rhodospirillaceae bacterium]
MHKPNKKPTLMVRNARPGDIPAVVDLTARVYGDIGSYSPEMILGQLTSFPEGQFVAEYEGKIVGYCATERIAEAAAMRDHTWREITGNGFASRHDPNGDYLYGIEMSVDRKFRGLRIGQRLYTVRKRLCEELRLRGIVFGGRLPGLSRRIRQVGTAEAYVEKVLAGTLRDATMTFQLRNGFEFVRLLKNYFPGDTESLGYAALLQWRNPAVPAPQTDAAPTPRRRADVVRAVTVQYMLRPLRSFDEFRGQVEYFVDVASDYSADFVVFPELFTLQLLSIEPPDLKPHQAFARLHEQTAQVQEMLSHFAVRYNINIIGGSHPVRREDGSYANTCFVCLRDGSLHQREKLHPTPDERFWWNVRGGDTCTGIMTDCGPIGITICYDSEFPEVSRHLVDQGCQILFVPFCTDNRQAYLRVRYCAQARAVENQCYVVLSGNVGNLPNVRNMDIQYAQSCILTPCDFPFARDGVAADTTPNVEMVAIADLRAGELTRARQAGSVRNLKDRRFDLYAVQWARPGAAPVGLLRREDRPPYKPS